jgi:hypothetical protein
MKKSHAPRKPMVDHFVIADRLHILISAYPSIEKRDLINKYSDNYACVSDAEVKKSVAFLEREKRIMGFKDLRGVSSWWDRALIAAVLVHVASHPALSTRKLFDLYRLQNPDADIVIFQKLLMQLKTIGLLTIQHSPAPSHWNIANPHLLPRIEHQQMLSAKLVSGIKEEVAQCA